MAPAFAEGWNFGPADSDARPVRYLVSELAKLWGDKARWQSVEPESVHEAHLLRLDSSKARAQLGWSAALESRRDSRPHRRVVQGLSPRRGCPRHHIESDPIIYGAIKASAEIKGRVRAGCECMTTEELREQILQLVTEYTKQRHAAAPLRPRRKRDPSFGQGLWPRGSLQRGRCLA